MITFDEGRPNQLLMNPRLPEAEKAVIRKLQLEFELKFAKSGHFLIASSGSTQNINSSVKLVALSLKAVLNSAVRFNRHFAAGETDHWGLVLPKFHVAGLGIMARAKLAGARVFEREWQVKDFSDWIFINQIKFVSLVPAQLFDLVNSAVVAPPGIRAVILGAGALDHELRVKARALKWPVAETYGMTETASMIAVKKQEYFCALAGVEMKTEAGILNIKCNSLLSATIQDVENEIKITAYNDKDWFATEDLAEMTTAGFRFLGRRGEYIKILGEGVSLFDLRNKWAQLASINGHNPALFELIALEDSRAGFQLIATVDAAESAEKCRELINFYNLSCRPYEKIAKCVVVGQIPRTSLGKLKTEDLKRIVREIITKD